MLFFKAPSVKILCSKKYRISKLIKRLNRFQVKIDNFLWLEMIIIFLNVWLASPIAGPHNRDFFGGGALPLDFFLVRLVFSRYFGKVTDFSYRPFSPQLTGYFVRSLFYPRPNRPACGVTASGHMFLPMLDCHPPATGSCYHRIMFCFCAKIEANLRRRYYSNPFCLLNKRSTRRSTAGV